MTKQLLLLGIFSFFTLSCLEQFNPRPDWQQFAEERERAAAEMPMMTADGEPLSAEELAAGGPVDKDQLWATYCASCHGANGDGNTPIAAAMNPKPRDMTDKAWQAASNDERIYTVIEKGGSAVGLAATMPAWGAELNDAKIKALIEKVRSFGK